ncbi:MAG: leucine-rich repeat domain-containing protein [Erysipelotrichales bacterium]|nr:leucine-rich repeat domain-containing protein [Erysipelotrichales bacterium]
MNKKIRIITFFAVLAGLFMSCGVGNNDKIGSNNEIENNENNENNNNLETYKVSLPSTYDHLLEYELASNGVEYTVTSVSSKNILYVNIPSEYNGLPVTSIKSEAFLVCENLVTVSIPDSVKSIGSWAFSGCDSLASIVIPSSVTSIGYLAFYHCNSLTIYCEAENEPAYWNNEWNYLVHNNDNTYDYVPTYWGINENNCGIKDGVYYVVEYGEGIVTGYTFNSLERVEVLNKITLNGRSYNVTNIVSRAFYNCSFLTSITIQISVTSIRDETFYGCSSLISLTIPSSVTKIGECAFENCSSLTSIVIPKSVTSIGYGAFSGCSSLTTITIPDGVTSIGDGTFFRCTSLTSIIIPSSVTSIGYRAFCDCSSLTSIIIPSSVTSIRELAFEGCNSLTIYCEASSQPSGWDSDWNRRYSYDNRYLPVYWAEQWSYVNGVPTPNK